LPIQNIWGLIANKKYMGTDCQYKIYGGRLPIKDIWGQIAKRKLCGQISNKNTWGPFSNIIYKNISTKNNYHAWHENWSTLHIIQLRPGLIERINIRRIIPYRQ
jgi:hypothetical protein